MESGTVVYTRLFLLGDVNLRTTVWTTGRRSGPLSQRRRPRRREFRGEFPVPKVHLRKRQPSPSSLLVQVGRLVCFSGGRETRPFSVPFVVCMIWPKITPNPPLTSFSLCRKDLVPQVQGFTRESETYRRRQIVRTAVFPSGGPCLKSRTYRLIFFVRPPDPVCGRGLEKCKNSGRSMDRRVSKDWIVLKRNVLKGPLFTLGYCPLSFWSVSPSIHSRVPQPHPTTETSKTSLTIPETKRIKGNSFDRTIDLIPELWYLY